MTDTSTLNVDLALRVLQYIREHPEQHNQLGYARPAPNLERVIDTYYDEPPPLELVEAVQPVEGHYACMTAACIAGWAVLLAGPEAVDAAYDGLAFDGRADLWFNLGRKLLGLSPQEAADIFLDFNDASALAQLEELVDAYRGDQD
jgi:hypothetical protein